MNGMDEIGNNLLPEPKTNATLTGKISVVFL